MGENIRVIGEDLLVESRVSTQDIGCIEIGQGGQSKVQTYDCTR